MPLREFVEKTIASVKAALTRDDRESDVETLAKKYG